MAEQTSIAASYARALADPTRVGIVAALDRGPLTVASLARRVGVTEPEVVREARKLETMGLVQVTQDEPRTYELLRNPTAWPTTWDELSIPVRRTAAATTLTQLHAKATAAVDAGGFDRGDMLLTRTSMPVTPEHWRALSRLLHDALDRVDELGDEAQDEAAEAVEQATAVVMLFTGEHTDSGSHEPPPPFGEDEARERSYEIVDGLHNEIARPDAAWERIEALAEQLRLVARAAMTLEDAPARQPAQPQR